MLVLVQDGCTVCAKCTIGSEIIHLMVLLGDEAQVGAHFGPFGDSANFYEHRRTICAEHTIGLEIISDAPDGTPR